MTTPLEKIIRQQIVENGPMDLATYMTICLTHPEYGYYTAVDHVFGELGDFTTAPEVSQLLGEMIGFWIADFWAQMGAPSSFILAEAGPGRGTLMQDILRILARLPRIFAALRLHLVEVSPRRISEQAQALKGYDVTWHDQVADLPEDAPLILVNNEFFDALPVRQLIRTGAGVEEVVVGLSPEGTLQRGRVPVPHPPLDLIEGVNEISPARDQVAALLFTRVKKQTGAVLTIDYGYDSPCGKSTIQALRNHQPVDFLETPGQADVTALVDFSALARLAREVGAQGVGPVGQGAFLNALGIAARAGKILENPNIMPADRQDILSGLERLTHDSQMGTLFRVLCVYQGPDGATPAGF